MNETQQEYTDQQYQAARLKRLWRSPWRLCNQCQRASLEEEWLPAVTPDVVWNTRYEPRVCPYEGCNSRLSGGANDWGRVLRVRPQFPDEPERSVVYDFRSVICY